MIDIEDIKKNYRNFDDSKIKELALQDASKLRPEVIPILIEEIKRRKLSETLLFGIVAQLNPLSPEELLEYSTLIQKQPCPICNGRTQRLNAIVLKEVISMIFFSKVTSHLKIACPQCLSNAKSKFNRTTYLMGWLSIEGILHTTKAIIQNNTMEKHIRNYKASEILELYIKENIGVIEANKDNPAELNKILKIANTK